MTRTNRDEVDHLTNEQLAKLAVYYLPEIGRHWSDSVFGITNWLDSTAVAEEWDDIMLWLAKRRNEFA